MWEEVRREEQRGCVRACGEPSAKRPEEDK